MQKRLKIKSLRNAMEESEYKVQLITEHMVLTCMLKKVKIKFNSIQNNREITCMQRRVQLNTGKDGRHLHAEGRARGRRSGSTQHEISALIVWQVFEKHIHGNHRRCVQLSTSHIFSLRVLNKSPGKQIMYPLTFTDSSKLSQISETLTCI